MADSAGINLHERMVTCCCVDVDEVYLHLLPVLIILLEFRMPLVFNPAVSVGEDMCSR